MGLIEKARETLDIGNGEEYGFVGGITLLTLLAGSPLPKGGG